MGSKLRPSQKGPNSCWCELLSETGLLPTSLAKFLQKYRGRARAEDRAGAATGHPSGMGTARTHWGPESGKPSSIPVLCLRTGSAVSRVHQGAGWMLGTVSQLQVPGHAGFLGLSQFEH